MKNDTKWRSFHLSFQNLLKTHRDKDLSTISKQFVAHNHGQRQRLVTETILSAKKNNDRKIIQFRIHPAGTTTITVFNLLRRTKILQDHCHI